MTDRAVRAVYYEYEYVLTVRSQYIVHTRVHKYTRTEDDAPRAADDATAHILIVLVSRTSTGTGTTGRLRRQVRYSYSYSYLYWYVLRDDECARRAPLAARYE